MLLMLGALLEMQNPFHTHTIAHNEMKKSFIKALIKSEILVILVGIEQ
jgi:hypothetical protein